MDISYLVANVSGSGNPPGIELNPTVPPSFRPRPSQNTPIPLNLVPCYSF